MRTYAIALILAGVMTSMGQSQATKPARGNAFEELRAIEQRLAGAWVKGDREYINRILGDDWSVTDAAGRILNKRQVIQEAFESTDRQIESLHIDEVKVRVFAGFAVVTGRTQARGRYKGSSMSVKLRFTDVFARRGGRWQVNASQATQITE